MTLLFSFYMVLAMVGFPLAVILTVVAGGDHKQSYRTGYNDGWVYGYDDCKEEVIAILKHHLKCQGPNSPELNSFISETITLIEKTGE